MTTPFWCLLIAAFLPFALAGIGARLRIRQLGSLDVRHPRVQALELRDAAARAYAAQQNAWEALALFTIAVFMTHLTGQTGGSAPAASVTFVVVRVIHAACYILDQPTLRTLSFVVGLGCCVWLYGLAITA